ncbi:MAG: HD domain-containing phosphohydrolase [Eubacteriales bacterium]
MKNKIKPGENNAEFLNKTKRHFALTIIALTIGSVFFLSFVWSSTMASTNEQALKIGLTAEISLNTDLIMKLRANPDDVGLPFYEAIKRNMLNLPKVDKDIKYAYIYNQKDGKLHFMVDSDPVDLSDYTPPGLEYTEADAEYYAPFKSGEARVTNPVKDRWGTWISVLVPIKNIQTGKVIAVLGIDYPVTLWYSSATRETLQASAILLSAYILVFVIFSLAKNYTKLKESQQILQLTHEDLKTREQDLVKLSRAAEQSPASIVITDLKGNIEYVNPKFTQITGYSFEEAIGKNPRILKSDFLPDIVYKELWDTITAGNEWHGEFLNIKKDGEKYWESAIITAVRDTDEKIINFLAVKEDITEKKLQLEEIEFLSYHDPLTGLFNRRFYEIEINRLNNEKYYPLTLVMVDVNGLKLTNDAFGHGAGDDLLKKVADILTNECRAEDIIARIGGDEFVILLPSTDAKHADIIINRINAKIAKENINNIVLSLSVGFATKDDKSGTMYEVFMKAEDAMYRHKLSESSSMRRKTIDLIMASLYEKNKREMLHSKRVSELCRDIATQTGCTAAEVKQIELAGLMHDIGKIGISESVLNKQGKLEKKESVEMERHSEIGYRILGAVSEFSGLADCVLEHHERWDGKGYPKGLTGEEISLPARIIAVADSYDAMTADRSYRNAVSEDEAANEIRKCSGAQFDPRIAKIFVEKILGKKWD